MNATLPASSSSARDRALVLGGGGSAGNAWLIGVIAGLAAGGVDATHADLIVGTSAGATAAAQITGASVSSLYEAALTPVALIGPDLRFDEASGRIVFDRANYFDTKGMESNGFLDRKYTDDEVLDFVRNIYAVLLTRGIRGTYVHVADKALRERLRGALLA